MHFYTIDAVKAGFMVKKSGIWYLTDEGEEALKLGAYGLHVAANEAYKKWRLEQPRDEVVTAVEEVGAKAEEEAITLEQIEQIALERLERHIHAKNAYELGAFLSERHIVD